MVEGKEQIRERWKGKMRKEKNKRERRGAADCTLSIPQVLACQVYH